MGRVVSRLLVMLLIWSTAASYGQTCFCCCLKDMDAALVRLNCSSESVGHGLAECDAHHCDGNQCTCDEWGPNLAGVAVYESDSVVPEYPGPDAAVIGGGRLISTPTRNIPFTNISYLPCSAIEPLLQSCSFLS